MNASPRDSNLLDYVRAAARFLAIPLDDAQASRVAVHLARTKALVGTLNGIAMSPEDEIAEIYRPAPFPETDPA